ncbi:MAG: hypothetical protein QXP04_01235, partial [Candidatus Nanoarchaeia archaeon]|nr:hypothetical protein [Candidatus Jingweiarchaeum tengchongense]
MEYLIREISGKKILVVDCGSCVNNASLGNGNCFKCVMNLLKENEVDELILRKLVDKHLDTHGVAILKDYARFLNGFEIKEKICKKCESKIMGIIEDI